ncbi:MAG: flagellar export protein FliJ [Tissierellaceae bacterium]|nr:flagellar export protein FliJ [Tissierellaceae bacterium]
MAKYKFKLDRILNYKERIEDVKKAEFAEYNSILIREEERLNHFNNYKKDLLTQKRESMNGLTAGAFKLHNDYLKDVSNMIENQKKTVEIAQKDVNKAEGELLVAMQEKKSFERLKEIKYEEYIEDEKKKEEKIIDTIVTFKVNAQ